MPTIYNLEWEAVYEPAWHVAITADTDTDAKTQAERIARLSIAARSNAICLVLKRFSKPHNHDITIARYIWEAPKVRDLLA